MMERIGETPSPLEARITGALGYLIIRSSFLPRGSIANPMAPGVRRERTTMEGAGQCSGDR